MSHVTLIGALGLIAISACWALIFLISKGDSTFLSAELGNVAGLLDSLGISSADAETLERELQSAAGSVLRH